MKKAFVITLFSFCLCSLAYAQTCKSAGEVYRALHQKAPEILEYLYEHERMPTGASADFIPKPPSFVLTSNPGKHHLLCGYGFAHEPFFYIRILNKPR